MHSDESGTSDGIFEGNMVVNIFSNNIIVESGIKEVFLIRAMYCVFFVRVSFFWCTYGLQLGFELGLELVLGLGCENTRTTEVDFFGYVYNQLHILKR